LPCGVLDSSVYGLSKLDSSLALVSALSRKSGPGLVHLLAPGIRHVACLCKCPTVWVAECCGVWLCCPTGRESHTCLRPAWQL